MIRLGSLVATLFFLSAASVHATPPTVPPPLETRLAKMKVIVVGLLNVDGEGQGRKVSLKVSHVLKCPADLKGLTPETELTVTPRPAGFSDQGGDGVWSLDIDRKGERLSVSKYEFITYGRNYEEIKEKLDAVAERSEPTRKTAERAEVFKQNLDSFQLQLLYYGPQDKPYYALTLSVLLVPQRGTSRFNQIVQIKDDQASRIVDHLAKDDFLEQAVDWKPGSKLQPVLGYTLIVSVKGMTLYAPLGWNLAMLKRLDGLHDVLDGDAKKAMELLLGRLSGHRREWEADEAKES